jgi:uncharacterized RDD family membrane protein YckC
MTCPSCGGELVPGADRCPVCEAAVAPRVEGALAADPRLVTPPAREKAPPPEPIRDIPALRRQAKERSWRDEVQQRVRSRRQKRAEAGLPLFDGLEGPVGEPAPAARPVPLEAERAAAPLARPAAAAEPEPRRELGEPVDPFPEKTWELAPPEDARRFEPTHGSAAAPSAEAEGALAPGEVEYADLPLGGPLEAPPTAEIPSSSDPLDSLDRAIASRRRATTSERAMPSLEMDGLLGEVTDEPEIELSAPATEAPPLERPARPLERVQAAAVDLALFSGIAMVVVYFAGRAARVDVESLVASWPWLAAYLGLLAVFYASYFTGTTGQTPGKLVTGLRVVGPSGRPPAYPQAAVRAVAGLAGIAVAGLGCVPMAFDPAARTLHDRLFRTRVVRL